MGPWLEISLLDLKLVKLYSFRNSCGANYVRKFEGRLNLTFHGKVLGRFRPTSNFEMTVYSVPRMSALADLPFHSKKKEQISHAKGDFL